MIWEVQAFDGRRSVRLTTVKFREIVTFEYSWNSLFSGKGGVKRMIWGVRGAKPPEKNYIGFSLFSGKGGAKLM